MPRKFDVKLMSRVPLAIAFFFIPVLVLANSPVTLNHIGATIYGITTTEKVVALSFDADMTPKMLARVKTGVWKTLYNTPLVAALEVTHTPATIFATGLWLATYPEQTKTLAQNPLFEFANHSYSHPSFIGHCFHLKPIPDAQDKSEILKTQSLLAQYAPGYKKMFRFPGLCDDVNDRKIVQDLGYIIVHSHVGNDSYNSNATQIANAVINKVKPGDIILLHFQGGPSAPATAEAVPKIILALTQRGFTFVKVSELLARAGN